MHIFKVITYSLIIGSCFLTGAFFYLCTHVTVDFSSLENYDPGKYSVVLDDQGSELTRFQLDRREPVPLEQLSPQLIKAFLAAEDQNFFIHHGISFQGIIRSFITNFFRGKIVQGASTITQQLVKLLFLDNSRTFKRKFKELFIALLVEQQFSKEQILQTYLNHVYVGCGIYGVEAASQRFWGHSAEKLTNAQAATLAGIVQSPERFCPLNNPEKTVQRRNNILRRMRTQKKISLEEYQQALEEPLNLQKSSDGCNAPHIKEMLRKELEGFYGKQMLYCGGLTIQTTLSLSLQKQSNKLVQEHLKIHQKNSIPLDIGFILLEGNTGKVKALVGGKDFNASQFNRVTQARRQIGSIFKPLIYAVACEQGARMDDICIDEPVTIDFNNQQWSPQNYNHSFKGPLTRAYALYRSLNTVAIQTLYTAGIENTIAAAHACGIADEIPAYPSIALGCVDTTVIQAASMFNCLVHQGILIKPYYIEWVKNVQGKKIYKHKKSNKEAISWLATSQIISALYAGMNQLRKKQPRGSLLDSFDKIPLIGKTGTTNDARSCFYVAATPSYTAAAYIGSDSNEPMGTTIFASQTVQPLVLDILSKIVHTKNEYFSYHPDLEKIVIDEITGRPLSSLDSPRAIEILVPQKK